MNGQFPPLQPGQPDSLGGPGGADQQPDEFAGSEAESGAAGNSVRSWLPPRITVKITGDYPGGPAGQKAWTEVYRPSVTDSWTVASGGRDSVSLGVPAIEANDGDVTEGDVYEARLHESGTYYVFWVGGSSPAVLAQLVDKSYSGDCPTYKAFRVFDTGACTYSDDAVPHEQAICLPVYSEQGIDLVVAPPPSPRKALPGTMTSDSAAGNVAWDNPDAVGESNDSWATCVLESSQQTQYLKVTDFCFNLPSTTTTIDNITVRVEAHADGGSVTDCELKLVVGGSITGTSQHTSTALGTTDSTLSVTQTPTTWTGGALTYSQINASDFGVAIRYANGSGARRAVFVDAIEMRVEFSPHSDGVVYACVVRLRLGHTGTCWLVDHEPRWENVEMDTESDPVTIGSVTYQPGWISRYDQASKTLLSGIDVLVLDLSQL